MASPFRDLEIRAGEVDRHKENKARLAQVFGKYRTTGQGSIELDARVDFGLTFIEEPFMHYGTYLNIDALADLLNLDPGVTPPLPICSGHVTAWDYDDKDLYIGAWVAVSVYFPPTSETTVPPELQPEIEHYFTFSGVGMKDIPLDMRD